MVIVKLLRCARLITTSRSRIFHYCLTTSNKIQLVAEYRLLGSSYTTFYWKMVNRTDTTRVWSTFTTISACYLSTLRIFRPEHLCLSTPKHLHQSVSSSLKQFTTTEQARKPSQISDTQTGLSLLLPISFLT